MKRLFSAAITILLSTQISHAALVDITFYLRDAETGEPLAARVELTDPLGRHIYPLDAPERLEGSPLYFYAWDNFVAELKTDVEYTLAVRRGFGWKPVLQKFTVSDTDIEAHIQMEAWYQPKLSTWYPGDMDTRFGYINPSLAMAAQGLSMLFRVVDVKYALTDGEKLSKGFFHLPGKRAYTGRDWGFGDFNVLGVVDDVVVNETSFTATRLPLMEKGKNIGGIVDILRPESEEVPVAAALDYVDCVRVVGPGSPEDEAWTEARVLKRLETYYDLLNCGFRIPISAGSGATETGASEEDFFGSTVIFSRIINDFSAGTFIRAIRDGRTWGSNGPVLTLAVNDKIPGSTLDLLSLGRSVDVSFGARSIRPIARVELLHNGKVVETLVGSATRDHAIGSLKYTVNEAGWMAARAFEVQENPEDPVRYAHTSPFYIHVRGQPNYRRENVQAFATKVAEMIRRVEDNQEMSAEEKKWILDRYGKANESYLSLLR